MELATTATLNVPKSLSTSAKKKKCSAALDLPKLKDAMRAYWRHHRTDFAHLDLAKPEIVRAVTEKIMTVYTNKYSELGDEQLRKDLVNFLSRHILSGGGGGGGSCDAPNSDIRKGKRTAPHPYQWDGDYLPAFVRPYPSKRPDSPLSPRPVTVTPAMQSNPTIPDIPLPTLSEGPKPDSPLGQCIEKIIGVGVVEGQVFFAVKWSQCAVLANVPSVLVNEIAPQMVIQFYEQQLRPRFLAATETQSPTTVTNA